MNISSQWFTNHFIIDALEKHPQLRGKAGQAMLHGDTSFMELFHSLIETKVEQPSVDVQLFRPEAFLPSVSSPKPAKIDHNTRQKIEDSILRASERYQIPPSFLRAVMKAESNFDPHAVSRAGAKGLMQLMPATAEELGVSDPFDIDQNIEGGARYLKSMLNRFKSIPLALAAYNAGPGNVEKYGEIPPFKETKEYVNKIMQDIRKNYA